MEAATRKTMTAQLSAWSLRIDQLAARNESLGARAGLDAHTRVDELKALLAIARVKFDEFQMADAGQQARLRTGLKRAWGELAAALGRPRPLR